MKKYLLLLVTVFLSVFSVNAGKQIHKYKFGKPEIIQDGTYAEILYDECQNQGAEGYPLMPMFNVNILLPQGESIVAVNILSVSNWEESETILIKPASRPFPISQPATDYTVTPNNDIYLSDEVYPSEKIDQVRTGYLAGHSIGSFAIYPVQWIPASQSATFVKEIIVEVVTTSDNKAAEASAKAKNTPLVNARINALVENPEVISQYTYPTTRDNDENDLLIITNEALQADFEDFKNLKTSTGFYTEIITVETIYATYDGADNQEKIRNCIIDYYTNHNTQYVILGGDSDPANANDYIIPHRGFFAQDELDIPSDMYYSCLDGTWNDDNDNRWGEGNETDLYAEVLIGRFCADQSSEIYNLTQKNIAYQLTPVLEDIEKGLMIGELLDNNPTYGGNYKDQIKDGSSANGYTTEGFAENFTVETIYDRDQSWNKYTIFNEFNNSGTHLLNHLGHSFTDYNMKMYCSDVTLQNFTNDGETRGFVIGYSQGCYNGSFDNRGTSAGDYSSTDCFAEYITNLARAEVACVSNSRYGWYMPSSTNSSSQMYDREFFDALFGEGITMIGAMNADSKEDNPGIFNSNDNYRWVAYQTNLFGDPTLDVWTAVPQDITASIPPSVIIGASEIEFQLDIAGARIAIMQNDQLIGRAVTNDDGYANVELLDILASTDPLTVSVIAHNYNRLTQEMLVISNQPYVVYEQHNINDEAGNNNGQVDFSETIILDISLQNVGDQPSDDVTATITTEDEFITIVNGTANFGIFQPGETINIEDAFEFTVADDIEDGHSVLFNISATDQSMVWGSKMYLSVNAPALQYGGTIISDTEGNNNGMMDAGETVDIIFSITNNGHADIAELTNIVSTTSEFLTINSGGNTEIEIIEAEGTVEVTINVSVDENTPIGSLVDFNCDLGAGAYSINAEKGFKVGLIVENFETGDFTAYDWLLAGNEPWEIVTNEVFEGLYAAKSGPIGNNQLSIMQMEGVEVPANDSIAFMVKVSTEATYDYLYFYMGDSKIGEWEGEHDWMRVSFAVPEGTHTFRWLYKKDQYETGGQDCAWIDFIELPVMDMGVGFEEMEIEASMTAMPNPASESLAIRIENPEAQNISIELRSLDGKQFSSIVNNEQVLKGVHVFRADISTLSGGVYILTMRNSQTRITKKVIIQK